MAIRLPHLSAPRTLLVGLLPLIAAGAVALPQESSTPTTELPPPLTEYMGRRIAPTMHWLGAEWLLRETREDEEHTSQMLAALGVEPGQTVCDLGCGVGYLTLPLAELVGEEGQVIAVDIQPQMLAQLEARAKRAGHTNIKAVRAGAADPKLAPRSVDLVLMVDVYHELGYPEQVLAAVRRALRPEGRLVLVEFRAEDPEVPIKPEHKMSRAQVVKELSANGFRLASSFDELPWQHLLAFAVAGPAEEVPRDGGGREDDRSGDRALQGAGGSSRCLGRSSG